MTWHTLCGCRKFVAPNQLKLSSLPLIGSHELGRGIYYGLRFHRFHRFHWLDEFSVTAVFGAGPFSKNTELNPVQLSLSRGFGWFNLLWCFFTLHSGLMFYSCFSFLQCILYSIVGCDRSHDSGTYLGLISNKNQTGL